MPCCRAATAVRSTGGSCRIFTPPFPGFCPADSNPTTSRRRWRSAARAASMFPLASRARRASRIRPRSGRLSRRPGARSRVRPWEWVDMSKLEKPNSYREGPNERGRFGIYGGRFVPETLMPLILSLEKAYDEAKADPAFKAELNHLLKHYVGRPSPLYFAERLTEHLGGAKIYFKREELNHTGSHKVNNVLGQIMVARRMGKKRIIAETGAGQHGVATATLCARFGLECVVYMGAVDVERQQANVIRMEMLGAKVIPVQSGSRTLKDAMNDALRDWSPMCTTRSTASAP